MSLYLFLVLSLFSSTELIPIKHYSKIYYENGTLKSEGWLADNYKDGYWKYYYENGKLSSKGHFQNNKKDGYWYFYDQDENLEKEGHFVYGSAENWWIFYEIGTSNKMKVQFKNNKKNGFALCYKNNRLIRAEKYINDSKTGEWTTISGFKRDNPNADF